MDLGTATALTAKLLGIGIATWKSSKSAGLDEHDLKAVQELLGTASHVTQLRPSEAPNASREFCELLVVAFGEAWRRHWIHDENLGPELQPFARGWFKPRGVRKRIEQAQARLRSARVKPPAIMGRSPQFELRGLDDLLGDPCASQVYQSLWEVFTDSSLDRPGAEPLFSDCSGRSRMRFERDVRVAFMEGLASDKVHTLRTWRFDTGEGSQRAHLVRELCVSRLLGLRGRNVLGGASRLARAPLEDIYVEPAARASRSRNRMPVQTLLGAALGEGGTRVVVVTAPMGMGKSLTAEVFVVRLAQAFLESPNRSPDLHLPILVRVQDCVREEEFQLDRVVRRAQKQLVGNDLPAVRRDHPGLGLPESGQRTVVVLDGLDEVHLAPTTILELFRTLCDDATDRLRFVVLTRPQVVPPKVFDLPAVEAVELEQFSLRGKTSQVEQWLGKWSMLNPERPTPTLQELRQRKLLELCRTPILLFMVGLSWKQLADQGERTRTQVYETFINVIARSKLEGQDQPVVADAAKRLRQRLVSMGHLRQAATNVDGMVWMLASVAWSAHRLLQNEAPRPVNGDDVRDILRELDIQGQDLDLVELGLVLTMTTAPTGGVRELRFAHKSFREFLVSKFWEAELLRILSTDNRETRRVAEATLSRARLLHVGDQSFDFLTDLLSAWPQERLRRLTKWADARFNDESLQRTCLRDDDTSRLRESALAIGSTFCKGGMTADGPRTLKSMLAWFHAVGKSAVVYAPGLKAEGTRLGKAELAGAVLEGAGLAGAHLVRADLKRGRLRGAQLQGADLHGADLTDADLQGANLEGANLYGAQLIGAQLNKANLSNANLGHADLERAHLESAVLNGADLSGASLYRSHALGAQLPNANLNGVDARWANFRDACLVDADLRGAQLHDACLREAQLTGAEVFDAQFDRADLVGQDIYRLRDRGAKGVRSQSPTPERASK